MFVFECIRWRGLVEGYYRGFSNYLYYLVSCGFVVNYKHSIVYPKTLF